MNGKQHFKVGVGAGIGTFIGLMAIEPMDVNSVVGSALGGVLAAYSSKLPDIDHNSTKIGRTRKKVTSTSNLILNVAAVVTVAFSVFLAVTGRTNILGYDIPVDILWKVAAGATIICLLKNALSKNKTVRWMTAHRGFMHTLVIPVCLIAGAYVLGDPLLSRMLLGVAIGYISHLDADMYTVDGSPILFPITTHSFKRPHAKKSEDKALYRIASRVRIRYIIMGIIAALLIRL